MSTIRFHVPEGVRWDATALRQFSENAPYYLLGSRVVHCHDRELVLSAPDSASPEKLLVDADLLVRSIGSELRDATEATLSEHCLPSSGCGDPMVELAAVGAARQVGVGRFAYSGVLLRLLDCLDVYLARIAADCGAVAHAYPTTVSTQSLIRSGYLKSFPQHALFVAPVGFTAERLAHVGRCNSVEQLDADAAGSTFAQHSQVLAPTVCYHCFEALRGQVLVTDQCFTAVNPCHRHEVLGGDSLARLHTFRMREVVAFGAEAYVSTVLDKLLEATIAALNRWRISHRVTTANDAFFAGAPGHKLYFQSAFALKRELRIRTDFDDRWIAAASFNDHQKSLTRVFSICAPSEETNSGCVGWGYERFAYALMSQLGVDIDRWPANIRGDLRI